jgi:predicted flavoprotein YhiN
MSWFSENWINIVEEDRWRLILESWDSKELLNILVKKAKNNNSEIKCEQDVKEISPQPPLEGASFSVITETWEKYFAKNVIISSWWKSFFQVGTTGEWYSFAENFWINIIEPHRALCWLTTKKDFKELSWSSIKCNIELFDNKENQNNPSQPSFNTKGRSIYSEFWPLLFTHFWLSWPIIFNTANAMWEYLNSIWEKSEKEKIRYILENVFIKINLDKENSTKKVLKFFKENLEKEEEIITWLQDWRSWKEAKATGWWIDLNELDKFMQSKKMDNLFFVWEVCDILGKTGGFNLQWAWSSWYCCWEFFKK